ncbi:MAG: TonB-dependent receptor [Breznakibacter sp.]
MKKSKLILLLIMVTFFTGIQAQTNRVRVTGTVTDPKGEVLIGVSVFETGTTTGTITDVNGVYAIDVSSPQASLTYSFIGFVNQVIVVGTQSHINVKLGEDNKILDEIVAVGYGVQRRKDVTGAVVSMKPDDLSQMPQTNVVQSLQGKVAGMSVINQGSSAEGDQLKLRIRAQKSISADAQPLIILDGIPYSGFLSEISPNDIESIEILKDASSAAVYGARAANGVLLITTKKGKTGKVSVSFNGYTGIDRYTNIPDMMSGEEFYNFKNERLGYTSSFETQQHEAGVDTDWIDLASRTGRRQDYNLSVSGGKEGTSYFISGNVSNIKGVAINDDYNRYTIRQNIETQLADWLKLGTNTQLGYYRRDGEKANFSSAMRMSPLTDPYETDGSINYHPWPDDLNVTNPLEPLNYQNEDVARSVVTSNFLQIDFPFIPGLSYRLNGGYNYRFRLLESYKAMSNTLEGEQKGGVANVQNQGKEDWTVENILTYTRSIKKHNFTLTGMYSTQQFTQKFHNNEGVGFPGDYMTYYQFKLATTLTPGDDYLRTSNLSQMLRLNYGFDSRYLLTLTARRDGYSAFGADSKFGIFPSAALGWNVEQEPFMQVTENWLDRLKLRLSYGENGNQAIDAYTALPTMTNEYYLDNDKNTLIGFYSNKLADPTLSWETTRQFNAGIDYSFLKGRISGSIEAYTANTYDLLLNKQIPQINGVSSIRQNVGETKSSGFEFQVSTINLKRGDFTWSTDFNIAFNKNEIVNVGLFDENGKPQDNLGNRWFIGKPINVVYSYVFDGIWQENDDILNSHMPTAKPGDVKVRDISGPDGVPDNQITADDMKIIGHGDPDYVAGMMNTFTYKGLSLSIFINAVHGVTRYTEYMNTYFDGKTNIRKREWWTSENPINTYPANRDDSNPFGLNYFGKENDASYIRLSDITLAYQFPKPLLAKIGVSNLEVFANAKNLYTITNYIGLDPEYTSDYSVPQTQSFIFGVKFSL